MQELYNASLNDADIVLFDGQLICEEPAKICKHLKMLNTSNSVKAEVILNLETDEHVIFSAYRRDFLYHLPRFRVGVYEDVAFSGWAYFRAKSIEHLPCVLVNKFQTPGQITENMTLTKAKQYMSARLDLTRKIVEFLPNHSQELNKFFESGLRGSIAVTLKKLKNYSRSQEDFNRFLREFFEFLSGEIDNLEHIVFNHSSTKKDIEAFSFYIDWKKNTL